MDNIRIFYDSVLLGRVSIPPTSSRSAKMTVQDAGDINHLEHVQAHITLQAMRRGDVPAEYKSHALRGNSEVITIRASAVSDMFDIYEAMRRARHSMDTQLKYYEREPHPAWVRALANIDT